MNETAPLLTNLILSKSMEAADNHLSLQDFVSIPEVSAGFHDEFSSFDLEEQKRYVIRLAIAMARQALPVWIDSYPGLGGPVDAVTQAEKWMDSPCDELAELASATQPAAVRESLSVWQQQPKNAAWAGRTAAWVADAPKYGWQAICAIMGAQQALGLDDAMNSAIRFHDTEKRRAKQMVEDQLPGIDVLTFTHLDGPMKDGLNWCTISFRVLELLRAATHTKAEDFPVLTRFDCHGAFEVRDPSELMEIVEETERIPGDDEEFRHTMGRIHCAAFHSWAAGETVSFIGQARIVDSFSPSQ